jgi:hypothetical protein
MPITRGILLSMLCRIAKALKRRLVVEMRAEELDV